MIPAWTLPLILKAVGAIVKHRKDPKSKAAALAAIRSEATRLPSARAAAGWVLTAGPLSGWRARISALVAIAIGVANLSGITDAGGVPIPRVSEDVSWELLLGGGAALGIREAIARLLPKK